MADSGFPWAVKTGDMKGVQEAVNDGEDVNQVSNDTNKRTPMHWAADYNQVEVMKFLVEKGANPDVKDNFGITPLLAAVYENHADAVEYLISLGADTNAKGPDGMTALEAAESDAIKTLLQAAAGSAPASAPAPADSTPAAEESEGGEKKFDRPPTRPAAKTKKRFGFLRKK